MREIRMPKLSDEMTEGLLLAWHVEAGQHVEAGEILAEVETDKANMEIETEESGVVWELLAKTGDRIPVGGLLATLEPGSGGATKSAPQPPPPGAGVSAASDSEPANASAPEFDVVVIGGGVTGSAFAAHAAQLGMRTCVVDPSGDVPGRLDTAKSAGARVLVGEGYVASANEVAALDPSTGDARATATTRYIVIASGGNVGALGLKKLGIELVYGALSVDEKSRTSAPNVFAIGGVVGACSFHEDVRARGRAVADTIYGELRSHGGPGE